MIEKIRFENFRGFEKIELPGLRPITLISGKNNSGKSSILEGMFLLFDHTAPESFSKINYFRGIMSQNNSVNLWESAFYQMDTSRIMRILMTNNSISSVLEYKRDDSFIPPNDINMSQEMMNQITSSAKSAYTLKFRYTKNDYTEDGHFITSPSGIFRHISTSLEYNQIDFMPPTHFINAAIINNNGTNIAEWFSRLELDGKKQLVVDILKLVDPTICDLSTIVMNGQVQLYAKMGHQLLPLRLAGDGLNKLLFIVLSIIANPDSIMLIDEIETGFHYSMFPKLWETIARAAYESNCQVIATTHSYECIAGAIDGIGQAALKPGFCYFRLDKTNNGNRVCRYSDDLLAKAIVADMEVR